MSPSFEKSWLVGFTDCALQHKFAALQHPCQGGRQTFERWRNRFRPDAV